MQTQTAAKPQQDMTAQLAEGQIFPRIFRERETEVWRRIEKNFEEIKKFAKKESFFKKSVDKSHRARYNI